MVKITNLHMYMLEIDLMDIIIIESGIIRWDILIMMMAVYSLVQVIRLLSHIQEQLITKQGD